MKMRTSWVFFGLILPCACLVDSIGLLSSRLRKQARGGSLDSILNEARLNGDSRQRLLANLNPAQQQQLASDLTALRNELQKGEYAQLRQFILQRVAQPMDSEQALDLLSRLNGRFTKHAWWQRINMMSVNKIFSGRSG